MKLKFISSIFILFLCFTTLAQNKMVDVVYLKDGSIIKGSIIEYFVNDYVIIESLNGKVYRYKAAEIANVNASRSIDPTSSSTEVESIELIADTNR